MVTHDVTYLKIRFGNVRKNGQTKKNKTYLKMGVL